MAHKSPRIGVFGPPLIKNNSAQNPELDPIYNARYPFGSKHSTAYTSTDALVWPGDQMAFVDMIELEYYNRDSTWDAGPTSNDLGDGVTDKEGGYWTDEPAEKTKFVCRDKNGNQKYVFNIGHASVVDDARGQQPLVIGYSGQIQFPFDKTINDHWNSHGVKNIYGIWYLSISEDNLTIILDVIAKIKTLMDCITNNPDDTPAATLCYETAYPDDDSITDSTGLHVLANIFEDSGVPLAMLPGPDINDIIEIIIEKLGEFLEDVIAKTQAYIEYLTELLTVWLENFGDSDYKFREFISKLSPESNNELELGKIAYPNDEYQGENIWFNLTCDAYTQRTIALLRLRSNGILIQVGCTEDSDLIGTDRETMIHGVAFTLAPNGKDRVKEDARPIIIDYDWRADTKSPPNFMRLAR